jgi:hypothetical protein
MREKKLPVKKHCPEEIKSILGKYCRQSGEGCTVL